MVMMVSIMLHVKLLCVKRKKPSRLYDLNFEDEEGARMQRKGRRSSTHIIIAKQDEEMSKMLIIKYMW